MFWFDFLKESCLLITGQPTVGFSAQVERLALNEVLTVHPQDEERRRGMWTGGWVGVVERTHLLS